MFLKDFGQRFGQHVQGRGEVKNYIKIIQLKYYIRYYNRNNMVLNFLKKIFKILFRKSILTSQEIDFHVPDRDEFKKGYEMYNQKERRGYVYFEANKIISTNWGNPKLMAQGVERLIRSWNRFFANFNFDELSECIDKNIKELSSFRKRNIMGLKEADCENIKKLFNEFLIALRRSSDDVKSPVSVAKALGLLVPDFFPIWDSNIAYKYGYLYIQDPAADYFLFCKKMKLMAQSVKGYVPSQDDRSLLKRIDEYNYSKYTTYWI